MTQSVASGVPARRVGSWLAVTGRAALDWYPRVRAQGRLLAERGRRRLATVRIDQLPRCNRLTGIGLALLMTSAVLWFSTLRPLSDSVADLEAEAARLESVARSGTARVRSPAAQLDAFVRRLPARTELPVILAAVVDQANTAGLELISGRYQFAPTKSGRIARYRLEFPVRGTYPQLRRFIDGTLVALPAVALEGMRLERKTVGEETLDAELRFEVVVRSGT